MKRPCLAPFHPFKQTWFEWHEGDSLNYCSSCSHFWKVSTTLLKAIVLSPSRTLYGDRQISLSREDAHKAVDEVYDAILPY